MRDLKDFWTGKAFQKKQDELNQKPTTLELTRFFVPEEYYDLHEPIFFKLIFNTKDLKEFGLKENQTTRAMDNIFCNNFNMKEFEKFLQDDTIKKIWWEGFGNEETRMSWTYYTSATLKTTNSHLPVKKRQTFTKALNKLSIQEFSILP